jgi:hypothetical protein
MTEDRDGPQAHDAERPIPSGRPRRRGSVGQSIGGVLFGFEQQVFRNLPPPHEVVHHARPDAPVPAGDGGFLLIELPGPGPDEDDRDQRREPAGSDEDAARDEHQRAGPREHEVDDVDVADRDPDPDRGSQPHHPG